MGRRIFIYVMIWTAVFLLLSVISLIKYKDVLLAGLENTFSEYIVGLVIIGVLGIAITAALRR